MGKEGDVTLLRVGDEELVVLTMPVLATHTLELSGAERHVLALILEGKSNASIAGVRGTAVRTVANQVTSIFRKLGVASRAELAARVVGLEE